MQYLQLDYTLGKQLLSNPYHIDVIRMAVTRNIGARFQEIHDEVSRAYSDAIKLTGNGESQKDLTFTLSFKPLFAFFRRLDRHPSI